MDTRKVIKNLSNILLSEMGREDLTLGEMAEKCGISKRKLCEIIYHENKGMRLETLITICENIKIDYTKIF